MTHKAHAAAAVTTTGNISERSAYQEPGECQNGENTVPIPIVAPAIRNANNPRCRAEGEEVPCP